MYDPLSVSRLRLLSGKEIEALRKAGLHNLWEIVERALTKRERRRLAKEVGIDEGVLLRIVRITDLCRVCNLDLAELLVEAGVCTPLELPLRHLDVLYSMVTEAAARLGLEPPDRDALEEAQLRAKDLPPLFDY